MVDLNTAPQTEQRQLYVILAFAFGVVFLAAILALVVLIPDPTKVQRIVFITVMALASGGVSTTISGMLNVNIKLGNQLVVGAAGALAVFVIAFFYVPAGAN